MKYEQMVVAQGVHENEDIAVDKLLSIFKQMKFKRPKIVGLVKTVDNNRVDLFFLLNNKDINKFSIYMLYYGFKWYEDIFHDREQHIYPQSFIDKYPPRW